MSIVCRRVAVPRTPNHAERHLILRRRIIYPQHRPSNVEASVAIERKVGGADELRCGVPVVRH